jgi:hypothetical protein
MVLIPTLLMFFTSESMIPSAVGAAPTIRWDTVHVLAVNGVPTLSEGGTDYALAADLTEIKISGHGTFSSPGAAVTGGGAWATTGASGTASGTFKVISLVQFEVAPGSLPPGLVDTIGDAANARSGLAILRIRYSDGVVGTLTIS